MGDSRKEEEKNSRSAIHGLAEGVLFSDAILLASIPVAAYAIVFFYELGYFSVFHIPIEFVSFDLVRIFIAILSLMLVAFTEYYIGELYWNFASAQPEPIRRRLHSSLPLVLITVVYLLFWAGNSKILIFVILSLWVLESLRFLIPLITQKNKKGYLAKLRAEDLAYDRRQKSEKPTGVTRLALMIGRERFLILIMFGASLYLAYNIGESRAKGQTEFRVVSTSPERVVLWLTGDHVLCAKFDRNTGQLDTSFVVLNVGEDRALEYRSEIVGPLKVKSISAGAGTSATPPLHPPLSSTPPPSAIVLTPSAAKQAPWK